jgi:hypothetical protein
VGVRTFGRTPKRLNSSRLAGGTEAVRLVLDVSGSIARSRSGMLTDERAGEAAALRR